MIGRSQRATARFFPEHRQANRLRALLACWLIMTEEPTQQLVYYVVLAGLVGLVNLVVGAVGLGSRRGRGQDSAATAG